MKIKTIGQTIRDARKAKGLKVYELADKAEITAVYITQIERYNKLPSFGIIKKIQECLGIDITTQYFEEKSPDVAEYIREMEQREKAKRKKLTEEYDIAIVEYEKKMKAEHLGSFIDIKSTYYKGKPIKPAPHQHK